MLCHCLAGIGLNYLNLEVQPDNFEQVVRNKAGRFPAHDVKCENTGC